MAYTTGRDGVWLYWASGTSTSTTWSNTTTDDAWGTWSGTTNTTYTDSGNTDDTAWVYWTAGRVYVDSVKTYDGLAISSPAPTRNHKQRLKERRRAKRQEKTNLRRAQKRMRKNKVRHAYAKIKLESAEVKAKALLLDLLGEEQNKVFEETNRLLIHGNHYDWLIYKHGDQVGVKRIEKDKVVDLCVYLAGGGLPPSDRVIGHMLSIKYDELKFKYTAHDRYIERQFNRSARAANF